MTKKNKRKIDLKIKGARNKLKLPFPAKNYVFDEDMLTLVVEYENGYYHYFWLSSELLTTAVFFTKEKMVISEDEVLHSRTRIINMFPTKGILEPLKYKSFALLNHTNVSNVSLKVSSPDDTLNYYGNSFVDAVKKSFLSQTKLPFKVSSLSSAFGDWDNKYTVVNGRTGNTFFTTILELVENVRVVKYLLRSDEHIEILPNNKFTRLDLKDNLFFGKEEDTNLVLVFKDSNSDNLITSPLSVPDFKESNFDRYMKCNYAQLQTQLIYVILGGLVNTVNESHPDVFEKLDAEFTDTMLLISDDKPFSLSKEVGGNIDKTNISLNGNNTSFLNILNGIVLEKFPNEENQEIYISLTKDKMILSPLVYKLIAASDSSIFRLIGQV